MNPTPHPTIRPAGAIIRPAAAPDWARIREICCATARDGQGVPAELREFFEAQWIGPYEKLVPEWAYVAEVEDGTELAEGPTSKKRVAGYITGCANTSSFATRRFWNHDLGLGLSTLFPASLRTRADTTRFRRRLFHRERAPDQCFSRETRSQLETDFPAHLHVNIDPVIQSRGLGGLLVRRLAQDLSRAGVPGLHLYCGPKPVRFYEKEGFHVMERIEFLPGVSVFAMGMRLR